jgi:hypothetical protein
VRFRRTPVALAAAFAFLTACQHLSEITHQSTEAPDGAALTLRGPLAVRTTLSPGTPSSGENVTVRSVIVNVGRESVMLESRMCGLDYGGSLGLTYPHGVGKCAAYSITGLILPGDSVVTSDLMRVSSAPGSYELRVRHALSPEAWVNVPVTVR